MKEAPDWFGCGRKITQESWDGFLEARRRFYEAQDLLSKSTAQKPKLPAIGVSDVKQGPAVLGIPLNPQTPSKRGIRQQCTPNP